MRPTGVYKKYLGFTKSFYFHPVMLITEVVLTPLRRVVVLSRQQQTQTLIVLAMFHIAIYIFFFYLKISLALGVLDLACFEAFERFL